MNVSVDLSELGKLQTLLAGAANKAEKRMPGILDAVSESVAEQARANAPVDEGELRDAVGILRRSGNGNVRVRWVGAEVKQAFFTEFGTSVMPPQPWLTPAATAGVARLGAEIERLGDPW